MRKGSRGDSKPMGVYRDGRVDVGVGSVLPGGSAHQSLFAVDRCNPGIVQDPRDRLR